MMYIKGQIYNLPYSCPSCGADGPWLYNGIQPLPSGYWHTFTCQSCGSTHLLELAG
jgi:hypothetical protein